MAACAALLASCTNEVGEGLGVDTPIRVTASVEGALTTRTDNSTESLSTFGLSIKDKDDSYTSNYGGENILAEKDNGTWTLDKTVLYQGSEQSYYAYAPYVKGHTGESLTFTVDANQATNDLQGSDLLHAAGKVESAKLDITLAHKLSKLTVTVKKKGETSPIEVGDVTLRGTVPTATLDLTSGDVAASDAATSEIKMWHNTTGGTYECILVPQATAFGVSFTYGGDTYLWESSSYTFEGGNAYTLALTFDGKVSVGEVTVSEWGEPTPIEGGTATEKDYTTDANGNYTVYTAEGLLKWAAAANKMVSHDGINCTLAADIDMGQTKWKGLIYYGTFDGNGHTITGLNECFITDNHGTVKNLTLVNPEILSSGFSAGAVAGTNYGIIENCHVVGGSVVGTGSHSGGIAVYNVQNGTIRACSTSTTVTLTYEGTGVKNSGGIVGENGGTILACYATGSITGSAASKGAISGERTRGEHIACYWSGDTEKGVGSGSADGTTKVEGSVTWETAMNTMNTALSGTGYQWIENTGENKEDRPLIITNE